MLQARKNSNFSRIVSAWIVVVIISMFYLASVVNDLQFVHDHREAFFRIYKYIYFYFSTFLTLTVNLKYVKRDICELGQPTNSHSFDNPYLQNEGELALKEHISVTRQPNQRLYRKFTALL